MNQTITLTESEKEVIAQLTQILDGGKDQIFYEDLSGDMKKVRGTISSLVKKNIVYVDKAEGGLISLLTYGE